MYLVAYDGSDNAKHAIDELAHVAPGAAVTVLAVWEPFLVYLTRSGPVNMGFEGPLADGEEIDASSRKAAEATAAEGADHARAAGLEPTAATHSASHGVAPAIAEAAAELGAQAIVVGSRGRSGLRSAVLGSTTRGLLNAADRAVLVVPAASVAEARHRELTGG